MKQKSFVQEAKNTFRKKERAKERAKRRKRQLIKQ